MQSFIEPLKQALSRESAVVLVTVIAVDGSVPREPGATLVVTANGTDGTIGGGNLEHSSIRRARDMLVANENHHSENTEQESCQLSLGPGLGQCCGGRVELLFEHISSATGGWVSQMTNGHELKSAGEDKWLFRRLENKAWIIATPGEFQKQVEVDDTQTVFNKACVVNSSSDRHRWFCVPLIKRLPEVQLYGAGHVGQAVVAQLSLMSCRITWIDDREDWLELQPEKTVNRVLTGSPVYEIAESPADACHIVMTHSHAVDFDICHAVLQHGSFSYLGLIGSATKRRTFIKRLGQRGFDESQTDRLCCPIGSLPLESSVPSVIALNLAAELAVRWEQTGTIDC